MARPKHPKVQSPAWPVAAIVLIALEAILLVAFQYAAAYTLSNVFAIRYMPVMYFAPFLAKLNWSTLELFLVAGITLNFAAIVVLELTRGSITTLFRTVFGREHLSQWLTVFCCLIASRYYFSTGNLGLGGDAAHHSVHTWIAYEALRSWSFPVWTPLLSVGTYFVQFYGFLFAYTSGALSLIFDDITLGLKASLGLIHVLSGYTVYLYVKTLTGSRAAGFLSALAYTTTFWHTQLITILGRYTASYVFALLPLPFYYIECLRRPSIRSRWHAIGGAISIALLSFAHPGYAFWGVGFLLLYVLVLAASSRSRNALPITELAIMFGLGLSLSAILIIPMYLEQAWTGLGLGFSMATQPKPAWSQLLVWSNYRARLNLFSTPTHWFGGYVGLSLVLLTAVGYALRRLRFRPSRDFPLIGLAVSLFITFAYEWPVLRDLSVVQAMGAARYLVFSVFFLSVLAGIAARRVCARLRDWRPCYAMLVTFILCDLGTTTFFQPYHFVPGPKASGLRKDLLERIVNQGTILPQGAYPSTRNLHTSKPVNSYLTFTAKTPTAFGLFEEHPRADREFVRPFLSRVQSSLSGDKESMSKFMDGPGGRTIVTGLRLLNVRHFIQARGNNPVAHLDLDLVRPITVSNRLWPYEPSGDPEADAFAMVDRMRLNPETGWCLMFLSADGSKEVLSTEPELVDYESTVEVDRTTIRFETTAESFGRLSYGYYPNLSITLNGTEVDYFETADGFIGLRLPAGKHEIVIEGRLTGLRKAIILLNIPLLLAALFWAATPLGVINWRSHETEHPFPA